MSEQSKLKKQYRTAAEKYLHVRISRKTKAGQIVIAKIREVATFSGLSDGDVVGQAVAAGLPMVETKLREIHEVSGALQPA